MLQFFCLLFDVHKLKVCHIIANKCLGLITRVMRVIDKDVPEDWEEYVGEG